MVEQAAAALRQAIEIGELTDPFPSENDLAEKLGISRPTLRRSLAILAGEGYLEISKGKRTRILRSIGIASTGQPRRVCVFQQAPRSVLFTEQTSFVQRLHLKLVDEGIAWEEYYEPNLRSKKSLGRLGDFIAGRKGTCWILLGASRAAQQFFQASGAATIVLGSCHPGVKLAAIDWNFEAVGRHSAGLLLRLGHRRLALLEPEPMLAGDLATRRGFEDCVARAGHPGAEVRRVSMDLPREEMRVAFERLMRRAHSPTAILTLHNRHTLAVLSLAAKMGVRIPDRLSLLARDNHPLLESVFPAVTRYGTDNKKPVRRAVRMIQALLNGREIPPRPHYLTPELISGETVGSAPNELV